VVAVKVSRQSLEAGALAPDQAAATRLDAEVATPLQSTTTGRTLVTRMTAEVCGRNPGTARATRLDAEVATKLQAPTTGRAQVSRLSAEVGARNLKIGVATRLDAEVAAKLQTPTTGRVQVSRITAEVAAHRGASGPVEPLPLASGIEVFLHNWASEATLRTSFLTDVSVAAATGAESRRGLISKPERTLSLLWHQHADDDAQRARIDRLLVMLRKLTNERVAVPLYMDQVELAASYGSGVDTIFFDTSKGRYFLGARVVIVQLDYAGQYKSHSFHLIEDLQDDRLVFTANLGVAVPAGALVMPMIDCEVALEAKSKLVSALNYQVSLDLIEVAGASQLPPVKTDMPTNAQVFGDAPIFDFEPDWIDSIETGRSRQGERFRQGRTSLVFAAAERSRQTHSMSFTGLRGACASSTRDDIWRIVEFWETRRGRLRSFWLVDQEQVWEPESIDPSGNFVGVHEIGDFADFQAELEGEWIGLVMADGTEYVREAVTVQQVLTVFRITVSPVLPTNLDVNQVVRISRGRRTRFDSDELEEKWSNTGYLSTSMEFIETLQEKNVSI
jgi:hypothetical protein